ncbi:MAG: VOC family protein [Pseudomonadota bacterium]
MAHVTQIDHLVLTYADVDATVAFYSALGMEAETFAPPGGGDLRCALRFGTQKINLHRADAPFAPHADRPTPGSADLCFLSDTDLGEWRAHLARAGIAVIDGPVQRTGARGPILSIYMRDPDGNLIEIANRV